jgi:hypothetical protein
MLSLKNDENVASKVINKKNLVAIWKVTDENKIAGSGSVNQSNGSPDPDPYQNVTDPRHWNTD